MTLNAAAIMTGNVVSVSPEDTVAHVAAVLTRHNISAVPVCDRDGALIGMISEGDLMRPFGQENALRRDWWLNLLAEGTELAEEFIDYIRLDRHRASDLMTRDVISAPPTATLGEIADLLARHRIKRVPIISDGRLVGIVSRADIVRALAQERDAAISAA